MKALSNDIRSTIKKNWPDKNFRELLGVARDAVTLNPPNYINSIFGPVKDWIPPYDGYSEFTILNLWRLRRTIKYLVNTGIPSVPFNPPPFGPPLLNNIFWHPTVILQRPDHNGNYTTFPHESWFFINGIMTNDSLAQLNAAYLSYLFHRPITLIQNSTDSFWIDLLECAIGKNWNRMTEPAIKSFPPIYDALKNKGKKRVVIIAHSQGTIIMAHVLKWLKSKVTLPGEKKTAAVTQRVDNPLECDLKSNIVAVEPAHFYTPAEPVFVYPDQEKLNLQHFAPLTEQELAKLEIYCFANCAKEMTFYSQEENGKPPTPWIENFGNENDIVARLGMLAPRPDHWGVDIHGPCYMHRNACGHFLNIHYLLAIQECQKEGRKQGGRGNPDPYELLNPEDFPNVLAPRLFDYLNGGAAA
jgi:hypothetical protein